MPDEPLPDSKTGLAFRAYLIEARSIGGLSGSPVFAYLGLGRPDKSGNVVIGQTFLFLIGIIRGHWDHEEPKYGTSIDFIKELEQVNMGMAVATPADELSKIIFGDTLVKARREHDAEVQKKKDITNDSAFQAQPFAKEDFEAALKKASRKVAPITKQK
jgi:hypothetical protein